MAFEVFVLATDARTMTRSTRNSVTSLLTRLFAKPAPEPRQPPMLRLVRRRSLSQVLADDRIVRELLRARVVTNQDVFTAWAHQQDFADHRPLWRIVADIEGTNSLRIFRSVAHHYSFRAASVSFVGTQTLIIQNRNLFSDHDWRRMVEMGVFPIREKNDSLDDGVRWTFASFDPSRSAVRSFALSAPRGQATLRYVDPAVLFEIVTNCTAFPKLHALPWYRKYVLGRLPIALRALPGSDDARRAA